MPFKPRGFENHGNSCYLASALHMLLQMDDMWRVIIAEYERNKENIDMTKYPILYWWFVLFQTYHGGQSGTVRVVELSRLLETRSRSFQRGEQQDAHEAMEKILDMLHDDLQKANIIPQQWGINRPRFLFPSQQPFDEQHILDSMKHWNESRTAMNRIWLPWMYGQRSQLIQCNACNQQEKRWEPFQFDMLPSIRDEIKSAGPSIELRQMEDVWKFFISRFQKRNIINHKWEDVRCEKCNKIGGNMQKMQYTIQYPRYWVTVCQDPIQWQDWDQIFTKWENIEFDIHPQLSYIYDPMRVERNEDNNITRMEPLRYRLRGWILHRGSVNYGHYDCILLDKDSRSNSRRGENRERAPPIWWRCNDERVEQWVPTKRMIGFMYVMIWEQICDNTSQTMNKNVENS